MLSSGHTLQKARPLAMVGVPKLLQLVLASLHVVLRQTLQAFPLRLHYLTDVSCKQVKRKTTDLGSGVV